jgi:hypothetical protein
VAYSVFAETEARSGFALMARALPWLHGRRKGQVAAGEDGRS